MSGLAGTWYECLPIWPSGPLLRLEAILALLASQHRLECPSKWYWRLLERQTIALARLAGGQKQTDGRMLALEFCVQCVYSFAADRCCCCWSAATGACVSRASRLPRSSRGATWLPTRARALWSQTAPRTKLVKIRHAHAVATVTRWVLAGASWNHCGLRTPTWPAAVLADWSRRGTQ